MTDYEKLEWIHFAIQEAQNGNLEELGKAIEVVEELREPHLKEREDAMDATRNCKLIRKALDKITKCVEQIEGNCGVFGNQLDAELIRIHLEEFAEGLTE